MLDFLGLFLHFGSFSRQLVSNLETRAVVVISATLGALLEENADSALRSPTTTTATATHVTSSTTTTHREPILTSFKSCNFRLKNSELLHDVRRGRRRRHESFGCLDLVDPVLTGKERLRTVNCLLSIFQCQSSILLK